MQAEWFEEFAKQLIREKGIKVPSEAVEQQLVADISVRARDVVLRHLLDDLDDDELKQLDAATSSGDTVAADRIVGTHQQVITTTLQQFRNMYLGKA